MMSKCEEKGRARGGHRAQTKANVLRLALFENRCSEEPEGASPGNVGIQTGRFPEYSREVLTALLEAERQKAEGLMAWQRNHFSY